MVNIPDDLNLRIPGPTPLPPEVRAALAQPMVGHRSDTFRRLHGEVARGVAHVLRTTNDTLILTASGTGGMEAAIANLLSPGDTVLSVSIGNFGQRFRTIAQTYGAQIVALDYSWGSAADPDEIASVLASRDDIRAVLVTHNETSTGVTNPLQAIAQAVKSSRTEPPLLIVDAISSAACIPLETDVWDLDVVISGSQKGWMTPPGLAFVAVSPAAWAAHATATAPRFYFDFTAARRSLVADQTPWTPAVSLFYALAAALRLIRDAGLENRWQRHARVAEHVRRRVGEIGLELVADPRFASPTVTAVRVPAGVDGDAFRRRLAAEQRVIVAGGQGPLKGRILRLGHMGHLIERDVDAALDAIQAQLGQFGARPDPLHD
jgi:aspartate aminotransferase-like enzyme